MTIPANEEIQSTQPIGQSLPRKEDDRLLRGGGLYADDLQLVHQLEMAVMRCPFPHARIRSLDISAALALSGVVQIFTAADVTAASEPIGVLRPVPGAPKLPYYALAVGRALHEGQAVASVVARSRAIAEDAIELIDVDYEPLPQVTDTSRALQPDAPVLHSQLLKSNLLAANEDEAGQADRQMEKATVALGDRFIVNRVTPLPMETRAIVVSWREGAGLLDVRISTQVPHLVRKQLAECLRLDESQVRVVATDVGGAYGQKLGIFPEDVLACLHTMKLGRPVKWIEDRMEHFRASTHGREAFYDLRIGAEEDGRITAITVDYGTNIGGWNSPFGSAQLSSVVFTGPYKIVDARCRRSVVLTNKTPVGAYRGYGQPEVNFAREVLLDRVARRLGLSPLEIRRRNMLRPEDLPWRTPSGAVYDNGDYLKTLAMVADGVAYEAHYDAPRLRGRDGRIRGIGLSSFVERTGYASARFLANRGSQFGAHESVTLRANRSGGIDFYTGVSSFGQGSETAFAQICASVTGVDFSRIRVHAGDTAASPLNTGAFASRTLIAAAGAIKQAGEAFRAKLLKIAAMALQADARALTVAGDRVTRIDDPAVAMPLADVFKRAIAGQGIPDGMEPGLDISAQYEPQEASFSFGSAAAIVAVDPDTGEFAVERFVMAHDCGVAINPMLVEGQVYGALVQGFGAALGEELRYDEETGQLVSGSMLDYFAPTAADVPPMTLLHSAVPSNVTTFGVRGVGEVGTIPPAAALTNAVCDALREYDVEISQLPLTPERVWRALQAKKAG